MNLQPIIQFLNKEFDAAITSDYYNEIEQWRQWWAGCVKSFHTFKETTASGAKKERTLYSMKMAKKICEDWASLLLNEKTKITVQDNRANIFLQGEQKAQATGGVFGQIRFWDEANSLVEKAFYSGTGAFVMKLDGLAVDKNGSVIPSQTGEIRMEYLPASCIFPLTVKYHQITEVAFASENTVRGKKTVYIEIHTLENGNYVIQNRYFNSQNGVLIPAPLPNGVAEKIHTGSPLPFFSIVSPNMVNPYQNNLGLGCAVFSQAIDNLKGVDIAYNNFNRDLWLGGKKVFYNRELTRTIGVDQDGNPIYIAPDDMLQQLFVSVGDEIADDKRLVQEFNPDLRVSDNREAVQSQLDYLSFKCGLGTRHYQFTHGGRTSQMTATQYTGEKQDLKQNAAKHGLVIEGALQDIVRAILWAGKNLLGVDLDENSEIIVDFADGYIVSEAERRAQDLLEIREGLLQPWEYRKKWYNEDEATAKSVLEQAVLQHTVTAFGDKAYHVGEDGV